MVDGIEEAGHRVLDALRARPDSEPVPTALRLALHTIVDEPVVPPERLAVVARVSAGTPSIRARETEKMRYWEQLLVPEVTRRLPDAGPADRLPVELRARALVGAALVCLRLTNEAWVASDLQLDVKRLLRDLFETVSP